MMTFLSTANTHMCIYIHIIYVYIYTNISYKTHEKRAQVIVHWVRHLPYMHAVNPDLEGSYAHHFITNAPQPRFDPGHLIWFQSY